MIFRKIFKKHKGNQKNMYPNYREDRKSLGYEAVMDTTCGL